jgi:hypothetical protein
MAEVEGGGGVRRKGMGNGMRTRRRPPSGGRPTCSMWRKRPAAISSIGNIMAISPVAVKTTHGAARVRGARYSAVARVSHATLRTTLRPISWHAADYIKQQCNVESPFDERTNGRSTASKAAAIVYSCKMLRGQLLAPRPFGRTGHVEDPTLGIAQRLAPNFAPQVQLERAQVRREPLRRAVPVEGGTPVPKAASLPRARGEYSE